MPSLVRERRTIVVVLVTLSMLALSGATSVSALPGPASFATGFGADTLTPDLSAAAVWFGRMKQLGSSWVRIPVNWAAVAPRSRPAGFNARDPGDPHYDWYGLDLLVRNAAASRQRAVLMVGSPPSWALSPGAPAWAVPGTWLPSARDYGEFAAAVATRFSGRYGSLPRVSYFEAWNEPNLPTSLAPQWKKTGRGYSPASPAIYRGLLNAFYAGVKAVQPSAAVLAAGLAPYGDRPGLARMHPVTFLNGVLSGRARFDAIDIHPYGLTPTHHAFNRGDVSVADIGRLRSVLRAHGDGSKPIWVTEIDRDSRPDPAGLSLPDQARYLARAFYELWRQGVTHVFWYQPHDLGGSPRGGIPDGGLFTSRGSAKPSSVAFRFPFVAVRDRSGLTALWGRAPVSGTVTIEVEHRGAWRTLTRLRTSSGGVFYARRRLGGSLTLRALAGSVASYPSTDH